jgi:motility quorum-sensing regulator/GCU-specific mRNA interferase toxin
MEKRKPHYDLTSAQAIVARDGVKAFTGTALAGAKALGLNGDTACSVVIGITPAMFYKSMTTHLSHAVWQDVYYAPLAHGRIAYIKLTLTAAGKVVIQFKEK